MKTKPFSTDQLRKDIKLHIFKNELRDYQFADKAGIGHSILSLFLAGKRGLHSDSIEKITRVLSE